MKIKLALIFSVLCYLHFYIGESIDSRVYYLWLRFKILSIIIFFVMRCISPEHKGGGVGLNLIGASRLVLYDVDWNPANNLQVG